MLILSRYEDESIIITEPDGSRIAVSVVRFGGQDGRPKVKLGIAAPREYAVYRDEIQRVIDAEAAKKEAVR